jgi:hypothetical protein
MNEKQQHTDDVAMPFRPSPAVASAWPESFGEVNGLLEELGLSAGRLRGIDVSHNASTLAFNAEDDRASECGCTMVAAI